MTRLELDRLIGRRFLIRLDEQGRPQSVFDAEKTEPGVESDLWVKTAPVAEVECLDAALEYADLFLNAVMGSDLAIDKLNMRGVTFVDACRQAKNRIKALRRGSR